MVITQPDRKKGRGRKPSPPPVKEAANDLGYDVVQPDTIKTPEFAAKLASLQPDLFVVIAYGHIIPKNILDIPRLGAINIHPSLLPNFCLAELYATVLCYTLQAF